MDADTLAYVRMLPEARKLLALLLASPAQAVAPTGWQPIESAPKDGTRILIWTTAYGGKPLFAWWDDDRYAHKPIPRWATSDRAYGRRHLINKPPTHWMPPPDAPAVLTTPDEQRGEG